MDFESVDDQPVDLIFALVRAQETPGAEHLRALARVSRLLRQAELREQLRQARTADAIHALLVQDGGPRPPASPRHSSAKNPPLRRGGLDERSLRRSGEVSGSGFASCAPALSASSPHTGSLRGPSLPQRGGML